MNKYQKYRGNSFEIQGRWGECVWSITFIWGDRGSLHEETGIEMDPWNERAENGMPVKEAGNNNFKKCLKMKGQYILKRSLKVCIEGYCNSYF